MPADTDRYIGADSAAGGGSDVLISVARLHAELDLPGAPVLLDVRWKLGDPDGHSRYLEGHIPGAVYVDMRADLASVPSAISGRHPLPSLEAFQDAARSWGIRGDSTVVAYDDDGGLAAARAWWLLRWAGMTTVHLLDGGLAGWRRAGHALQTAPPEPAPGDVVLSRGHLPVLDLDDAARLAQVGALLDARSGERFRGEVEPIDPRAGHIPGAISAPTADNLQADGTFASPTELRARFEDLGVDAAAQVGVYCGSGVTAAHEVAALAIAGFEASLCPGSWSQWCADPARPVATGE